MRSDTLSWAAFGWFVLRTASTTVVVSAAVFGIFYFLYSEAIRGFETTFSSIDSSVTGIRADISEVRKQAKDADVRTADRLHELLTTDGEIRVSIQGNITELTRQISATNANLGVTNTKLDGLITQISATNDRIVEAQKQLNDRLVGIQIEVGEFRQEFRDERNRQAEHRDVILKYFMEQGVGDR